MSHATDQSVSDLPGTDPAELDKFEALAHSWWDPAGEMRALHEMNPVRMRYIAERCSLAGASALDVGCGGGLVAEALARSGAEVTGIDMATGPLAVARLHALESGLSIDYRQAQAGDLDGRYDVVTCLEVLEHVPDPAALVKQCAARLRPGGNLFLSTINRTPLAWLLTVAAAEYLLRLIPPGTHDWSRFIRPSELAAMVRGAGLEVRDITGLRYHPLAHRWQRTSSADVNYLLHARRH